MRSGSFPLRGRRPVFATCPVVNPIYSRSPPPPPPPRVHNTYDTCKTIYILSASSRSSGPRRRRACTVTMRFPNERAREEREKEKKKLHPENTAFESNSYFDFVECWIEFYNNINSSYRSLANRLLLFLPHLALHLCSQHVYVL